jgi:methionyl-tRNA formyltransferase
MMPMRIVLLTHGGAEPLLVRLAAVPGVTVAGVVIETDTIRRRPPLEQLRRSIRYDGLLPTLTKLARRLTGARRGATATRPAAWGVRDAASGLGVPVHLIRRYADEDARALMAALRPDLGVTWGTGILPPRVFELPRLGTINLHQGLTPLYRGGPSVFWELFNGESRVGLTVHQVAAAVDAGDVILQTQLPLEYDYARFGTRFEAFLDETRAELRAHGVDLVAEAVRRIADGTAAPQAQDLSVGRRYRLPTHREQQELRRRLRARGAAAQARDLHDAPLRSS